MDNGPDRRGSGISESVIGGLVQDAVLPGIIRGKYGVGMGSLKGVQIRMPKTGHGAGQVKVQVVMLTLGEVMVHGRTQKH